MSSQSSAIHVLFCCAICRATWLCQIKIKNKVVVVIKFWFIFSSGTEEDPTLKWKQRKRLSNIDHHIGAVTSILSDEFVPLRLLLSFTSVICGSRHFLFQHFYLCGLLQAHFKAGTFQIWVKYGSIFKGGESRGPRLGWQDLQCKCSPRFESKIHKPWRGLRETSLSVMDEWKACRMWLRRTLKEHSALNSDSVWLCKFTDANTDTLFCTVL